MLKQFVDKMDRGALTGEANSSLIPPVSDELKRHIRELYPMLLDGMLVSNRQDMGLNTLRTLSNLANQPFSPEFAGERLCEALGAINTSPRPKTKAGLVPVSPRRMRAWWDASLISGAIDGIHEADRPKGVLRFYDITGLPADADHWNQVFDIDADLAESGKTIDFWAADKLYRVELGLVFADGRFVRIARMNPCALPRENAGDPGSRFVRCNMPDDGSPNDAFKADEAAWNWFFSCGDWPRRDQHAELTLRMVYREFQREGPRVLRKLPGLAMPSVEELESQYQKRGRMASSTRHVQPQSTKKTTGRKVLLALLDPDNALNVVPVAYPLATARRNIFARAFDFVGQGSFDYASLLRLAVAGTVPIYSHDARVQQNSNLDNLASEARKEDDEPVPDISHLVQNAPADMRESFAWRTASIFDAAKGLNKNLSQIPALVEKDVSPSPRTKIAASMQADDEVMLLGSSPDIGGAEGRRFAKAGIALSKMALSLEGRVRPGAKFKVAGKYVTADRTGRFRVECVLSGKNIRIPMQVDNGRTGLARGMLRVEWDKSDRKKEKLTY